MHFAQNLKPSRALVKVYYRIAEIVIRRLLIFSNKILKQIVISGNLQFSFMQFAQISLNKIDEKVDWNIIMYFFNSSL